jgi:hypothetical protein
MIESTGRLPKGSPSRNGDAVTLGIDGLGEQRQKIIEGKALTRGHLPSSTRSPAGLTPGSMPKN